MKGKTLLFLIIGLFILTAVAISVSAAETPSAVESILAPFGSRLEEVYYKFSAFIDAAIYLIIFLGLTQVTLGHRFESRKGGRAITIGVGLVMAIGLAIWETKAGFNIASFGPVAAVILLALMGYTIWAGIRAMEIEGVDNITVAAMAYILVYYSMSAAVPSVIGWLNKNVPVVGGLLALIAAAFTIYLLIKIITWMISLFGGGSGGTTPPEGGTTPPGGGGTPPGGGVGPEPGKPKKPEEPEEPKNVHELKLAQSLMIHALNSLKHIKVEGCSNFTNLIDKWARDWKANKKKGEAEANARVARAGLDENLMKHFKNAVDNVAHARAVVAGSAARKKYAAGKDELSRLAAEIESTMKSAPFKEELRDCIEYYDDQLKTFIRGGYDAKKGKGGQVYQISPAQLAQMILHNEHRSIRKGLTRMTEAATKYVEVNLEKLNHIITKLS